MTEETCQFCEIIAGRAPANILAEWPDALAIKPLGPVIPGHALVIPKAHVADHAEDPDITALTARRFAEFCKTQDTPNNLISNMGGAATQKVRHLHMHFIPRAKNDGLALPWHSGKEKKGKTS